MDFFMIEADAFKLLMSVWLENETDNFHEKLDLIDEMFEMLEDYEDEHNCLIALVESY